jgi:hypothetical protein
MPNRSREAARLNFAAILSAKLVRRFGSRPPLGYTPRFGLGRFPGAGRRSDAATRNRVALWSFRLGGSR